MIKANLGNFVAFMHNAISVWHVALHSFSTTADLSQQKRLDHCGWCAFKCKNSNGVQQNLECVHCKLCIILQFFGSLCRVTRENATEREQAWLDRLIKGNAK